MTSTTCKGEVAGELASKHMARGVVLVFMFPRINFQRKDKSKCVQEDLSALKYKVLSYHRLKGLQLHLNFRFSDCSLVNLDLPNHF